MSVINLKFSRLENGTKVLDSVRKELTFFILRVTLASFKLLSTLSTWTMCSSIEFELARPKGIGTY